MRTTRTIIVSGLALVAALMLLAPGCGEATADVEAAVAPEYVGEVPADGPRDAGDEAFVRRAVPLMWGRHPQSVREVDVLLAMLGDVGREGLIRAMARTPEYRAHWGLALRDAMAVERHGFDANGACYGRGVRTQPGPELAEYVRDTAPDGDPYGSAWTLGDLFDSALILDDLSPLYRANLVGSLFRALDDRDLLAAKSQRRKRAERFMQFYLNRRMLCMGCHNTSNATTDSPDPELDRHWPVEAYFEKALFGEHEGRAITDLNPYFRRKGVVAGYYYTYDDKDAQRPIDFAKGVTPWGWDESCGRFWPRGDVWEDDEEDAAAFFIEEGTSKTSFWQLETRLQTGFDKLRAGMQFNDELDVEGEVAFAWLVSMNIADVVWGAALGSRLTVANFFPRSREQRDLLQDLTTSFVDGGYSLTSLLVKVATHPYFNGAVPLLGDAPEPYKAIFDPFVADHLPPADRRNHIGHTMRRAPARILLNAAYRALGWPAVPEYLIYFASPTAELQRDVGVFLKSGDPGFGGIGFQSALAWEAQFGVCTDRAEDATCPLQPILDDPIAQTATVCELCNSQDTACEWDARCCDVAWDAYCDADFCDTGDPTLIDLATFPRPEPPAGGDFVDLLAEQAASTPAATLGDAVSALKDRVLAAPAITDEAEVAALEALLGVGLQTPYADVPDAEQLLRRACGIFISTPQFLILGNPGAPAARTEAGLEVSGTGFDDFCQSLGDAMFGPGKVTCAEGGSLTVNP